MLNKKNDVYDFNMRLWMPWTRMKKANIFIHLDISSYLYGCLLINKYIIFEFLIFLHKFK